MILLFGSSGVLIAYLHRFKQGFWAWLDMWDRKEKQMIPVFLVCFLNLFSQRYWQNEAHELSKEAGWLHLDVGGRGLG